MTVSLVILSFFAGLLVLGLVVCAQAWRLRLAEANLPSPRLAQRAARNWRATSVLGLILGLLAMGCATNPVTGQRQLALISEQQEIALGHDSDRQVEASLGLYDDRELQAYVARVGKDLAARSERPELPWSFEVVDDPVVNAFALPGGYIYVTRGLLAHLTSEAELAAVLGHEIGHVTARHAVTLMSQQQLAGLALGIGMAVAPELRGFGDLAQTGLGLLFLKYGRDAERQADDLGLRYMIANSYDAREMPEVFTMLQRVSEAEGAGRLPDWMASHPNPGDRRERAEQAIAQLGAAPANARVARTNYLQQIDGIVYGENPRAGFFEQNRFVHPEMAFRVDFPSGWKTANQRQRVAALSPGQDALIELMLTDAKSADEAAQELLGEQGIRTSGFRRGEVNGQPAATGEFAVTTESGEIHGAALFVEHRGRVFRVLGYGTAAGWQRSGGEIERALGSFAQVTDRRSLDVQPRRLDLVQLPRRMNLQEFAKAYPSKADVPTLSLLNQVEAGTVLDNGQLVKRIVG